MVHLWPVVCFYSFVFSPVFSPFIFLITLMEKKSYIFIFCVDHHQLIQRNLGLGLVHTNENCIKWTVFLLI